MDIWLKPTSTKQAAINALDILGVTEVFAGPRIGTIDLTWNNASNAGGAPSVGDKVRITVADGRLTVGELTAFSGGAKTASVTIQDNIIDEFRDIGGLAAGTMLEVLEGRELTGTYAEIAADVTDITIDISGLDVGPKFDHHVAVLYHPNLMTAFAIYDTSDPPVEITPAVFAGPHLMIRGASKAANRKIRSKFYEADLDGNGDLVRKTMPAGIAIADAPTTIVWA